MQGSVTAEAAEPSISFVIVVVAVVVAVVVVVVVVAVVVVVIDTPYSIYIAGR